MAIHSSILAWRIPMYRGAWQATVHTLSNLACTRSEPSLLSSEFYPQIDGSDLQTSVLNYCDYCCFL